MSGASRNLGRLKRPIETLRRGEALGRMRLGARQNDMFRRQPNLHVRIVGLFLIAILPLAVFAAVLASRGYTESVATKNASLRQAAALVAARESALIEGIRRTLTTLASLPEVRTLDEPACTALLGAASLGNPIASDIAVFGPAEGPLCATHPTGPLRAISGAPWMRALMGRAIEGGRMAIGASSGTKPDMIAAALPLKGENQDKRVLVMLARPGSIGSAGLAVAHVGGATSALLTQDWRPISLYSPESGADWMPKKRPFDPRVLAGVAMETGIGNDGEAYVYTAAPVPKTDLFVLSAAAEGPIYREERRQRLVAITFPLVLLAVWVATAWLAVDRLVLRWIKTLRETASAYGAGQLEARTPVPVNMPAEIADLGRTFNTMAARVQERSAELEQALEEKTTLLRELHHRVKNNFQVIASLLALQKRSLGRDQKALLRYPEDRVQALATAYRLSYASGAIGRVDLAELVTENATYMRQSVDLRSGLLVVDAALGESVEIDLDTAIPLSLLLAELLAGFTDAAKEANRPTRISVAREDGGVALLLSGPPPSAASPLSARLARAFVQQLGGQLDVEEGDPTVARIFLPLAVQVPAPEEQPVPTPG